MDDSPPPDRVERAIRGTCGALAGLTVGLFVSIYLAAATVLEIVAVTALFTVACTFLAIRYGDRFWYALRHLPWFYWP